MQFQPLYDRLLVQRCEAEKYQGMIEIPDSAKEKPMEGLVLAVGSGRYNDAGNLMKMSVVEGDRILMGKYAGTEIKIDGKDLLILREDEVLGVVKEEVATTLGGVKWIAGPAPDGTVREPILPSLVPPGEYVSPEAFLAELRREAKGEKLDG